MVLTQSLGERFITLALKNTDERVRQEKTISPGFLFATLLWHEVLTAWNTYLASGEKSTPALHMAMSDVLAVQEKKLAIPRRYDAIMKEIWAMQPRFLGRAGRRPFRLLEHPRFRAAYDFMLLRCESGEIDVEIGHWWGTFQHAKVSERENMLLKGEVSKKRRRRRARSEIVTRNVGNINTSVSDTAE
jgi:poly(A) polymerase